jgi:hypothetical protein
MHVKYSTTIWTAGEMDTQQTKTTIVILVFGLLVFFLVGLI